MPADGSTESLSSLNSPIIFGIFSNAALGGEEDSEAASNTDQVTQIFQLQPKHRVFSAQSSEMRLSCDRERPRKSGAIFEGLMINGVLGEMDRISLVLMGKDKNGMLKRPGNTLRFKVDDWWLLREREEVG